jgi:hypothetical protein
MSAELDMSAEQERSATGRRPGPKGLRTGGAQ